MRTFSIYTLGCKVNQYEGSQIRQLLEDEGLQNAMPGQKPDLCVINTCCVTATASAKSRQYIQRAKKSNEQAMVVVCGCLAGQQTNELNLETNNPAYLVAGRNTLASQLQNIVRRARSGHSANTAHTAHQSSIKPENNQEINTFAGLTSLPKLPLLTSFKEQTRAFLKVQDGCEGQCSYCIIPKVRPEVQSKSVKDAVFEAKNLVSAGHKEIVVTGVNLGAYGASCVARRASCEKGMDSRLRGNDNTQYAIRDTHDKTLSIVDLLTELAQVPGLARLRVSSLEPGDITEGLLDVFCGHKNIMPHIHLSVQSGSGRILRRMCRQYDAVELREKIELIRHRLDRPAITCDIIVGFPGETDEDFKETFELAEWAGFSKIHVFPFSARADTAAMKMKDKVPSKIIKQRAEVLRKLGDCLGHKFREQFVGETCEVLLEHKEDENPYGRCERYFMVSLATPVRDAAQKTLSHEEKQSNLVPLCLSGKNEVVKVKITDNGPDGAFGEVNGKH